MTKDERLIQEAIDTFSKIRHWVDPDFYREHILPTVKKLKDRMAKMDSLQSIKRSSTEPDTIPSQLSEFSTNYGIFKDD